MTGVSATPANVGVVSPVLELLKGAYGTDGGNLLTGVTSSVNCADGGTISSDATPTNFSISGKTDGLGQYTYTVKNLQPFVSTATDLPTSGALVVTGTDSSVIVNAITNGVRLDYSDNPSGVVTNSSSVSWSDFFSNY